MPRMLLARIAQTSADVAATSSRLKKVGLLAECLAEATPDEVAIAVSYLSGELPQGTVGVGWAALQDLPPAAEAPVLELRRLEGASDPDDMLAIAAIECPNCAHRGSLVLNYGPTATAEDSAVLLALGTPA